VAKLLISIFLMSAGCATAQVDSPSRAWSYLTAGDASLRWVIVSSKKNPYAYVQCENMRTFVRCPFPAWSRVTPGERRTRPTNLRGTPYPDVPGAKLSEYLSPQKVAALKKLLARLGLKPVDVYSQAVNPRGAIVGTTYDVTVVLELDFAGFERLVKEVLVEIFETAPNDGYQYETGRWEG